MINKLLRRSLGTFLLILFLLFAIVVLVVVKLSSSFSFNIDKFMIMLLFSPAIFYFLIQAILGIFFRETLPLGTLWLKPAKGREAIIIGVIHLFAAVAIIALTYFMGSERVNTHKRKDCEWSCTLKYKTLKGDTYPPTMEQQEFLKNCKDACN